MAGKVAVLNDLAGFGRCSLTAAISVLSAMGVQPCPLPTAVLSAQTGFESYFFQDLTEQMGMITEEWKKSGAQFDGIVTGFMSDHRQIGEVNHFLDLFHKEGTFLLVDPVLGDNGKRFSVFDGLFQKEMKQLVKRADIVTPNVTELCLLTDYDYDKIQNISETGDREALFSEVSKAAGRLLDSGVSEVIVTGVLFEEQDAAKECTVGKETGTGGRKVANLTVTREKTTAGISSFIGASYSGTGDLFASVIAGGKARGARRDEISLGRKGNGACGAGKGDRRIDRFHEILGRKRLLYPLRTPGTGSCRRGEGRSYRSRTCGIRTSQRTVGNGKRRFYRGKGNV